MAKCVEFLAVGLEFIMIYGVMLLFHVDQAQQMMVLTANHHKVAESGWALHVNPIYYILYINYN